MDEEIERLVVSVRADTSGFARDVAAMRGELEGPLAQGAGARRADDRQCAGQGDRERQVRLRRSEAGRAVGDGRDRPGVAARAVQAGRRRERRRRACWPASSSLIAGLLGCAGAGDRRAGQRRARLYGRRERAGIVRAATARADRADRARRRARRQRVIAIQTPAPGDPQVLRQSSRQVARAVRSALAGPAMNHWFTRPDAPIATTFVKRFDPLHWTRRFPARGDRQHGHRAPTGTD